MSCTAEDLAVLSNPTSLLFVVERPNIFADDLVVSEILGSSIAIGTDDEIASVKQRLRKALLGNKRGGGPLGMGGNAVFSKWAQLLGLGEEEKESMARGKSWADLFIAILLTDFMVNLRRGIALDVVG